MLFYKPEFLIFFSIILCLLLLVKQNRLRKLLLLTASYYFYAYWDWRFCFLLLASTLVGYLSGLGLGRTKEQNKRRILVIFSVACNLGLLGFFKYFNFFVDSFNSILGPLGFSLTSLRIILPVGISFYTFQTINYTIDSYRGKCKPCGDFFDFALFAGFFPQLLAGPIVRAVHFLPQLCDLRQLSWQRFFTGFRQFVYGLFKKLIIADTIAYFVNMVFANIEAFDGLTVWTAAICYTIQIYCDFSGYSDMAIGVARVLGYDFPENFAHPYLSRSITEFWRRWHISLSSWLRDYLYIPLGGNRKGSGRTYLNLMIVMLLGGLWHGAAWTFVIWGAFHGISLAAERFIKNRSQQKQQHRWQERLSGLGGWAVTMLIVIIGWVFFRAPTFTTAMAALGKMFLPGSGIRWLHPSALSAIGFVIFSHGLQLTPLARFKQLAADKWYTPVILFLLILLVIGFFPRESNPFIYLQF